MLAIAQVGMEMVAPIGIGVAVDYAKGWTPWSTICGVAVGLIVGLAHLFSLAKAPKGHSSPSNEARDQK